ncbi:MAG TPA: hypothetical protein G4O15_08905 [Dehalococcoidia bacterium]|nr:hypothetical protein [Dehalococcoidia bacterium]
MRLVYEDEHGAYQGVTQEFLKEFKSVESNPHFDVFDSLDNNRRFIAVKSSRIPDDENPAEGRFGIDFNRARPTFQEAVDYAEGLPDSYLWQADIAFAAADMNEYERKSSIWDSFYSFIWDTVPQTVWVAPHSGNNNRLPHDYFSDPKMMIDTYSAGVAALCAFREKGTVINRNLIVVHSTGQLGAVLNLGDFDVLKQEIMDAAAAKVIPKYQERVQKYADEFKHDYSTKTWEILNNIFKFRGTLDPLVLQEISQDASFIIGIYSRCLDLYGQKISEYSLEDFSRALENLSEAEVPVILNNFIYPGRNAGRLIKLPDKIREGEMNSAVQVEGARLYMAKNPELVADILLDVKKELFD